MPGLRKALFWSFFSFSPSLFLTFHEHEFCYSPWFYAYWISIFWIFFTSGFSCASRAWSQSPKGRSPLLSSQHLHLALLIIYNQLSQHLSHLLVTTSCLRIPLHPLSQRSHLHLCAWMGFPDQQRKSSFPKSGPGHETMWLTPMLCPLSIPQKRPGSPISFLIGKSARPESKSVSRKAM